MKNIIHSIFGKMGYPLKVLILIYKGIKRVEDQLNFEVVRLKIVDQNPLFYLNGDKLFGNEVEFRFEN